MQAISMQAFGGPETLVLRERTLPEVGPRDVRVSMRYVGLNPVETYIRQGNYGFKIPELPYTPGFDGAGVVTAIGSDVTQIAVGDRVFVAAMIGMETNTGTYAQEMVVSAQAVHPLGAKVSFQAGAALGVSAIAADRALHHAGQVTKDDVVLVHGATGSVGTLAVQMAKAAGAFVIGTASSESGRQLVKELGADQVLNHLSTERLSELARTPTLIIEMAAHHNLALDLQALAPFGRVVIVGSQGSLDFDPRLILGKEAVITGVAVWRASDAEYAASYQRIVEQLNQGQLHPQVGDILPLAKVKEAHERIASGTQTAGKLLLEV